MCKNDVCSRCDEMLAEVYTKYANLKSMFNGLSNCVPDMVWAKDTKGKYTYANNMLAYKLYRTSVADVIGKTDAELAAACKKEQGCANFTFGQMCGDSDREVLREQRSMKFLEEGIIDGRHLILMVHKNVERDIQGNVVGTVGIGRDVTFEYEALKDIAHSTTDSSARDAILAVLHKNYYTNKDSGDGC